ncbi:MAG: hypothetical protein ACJ746_01750 [Bryobacteraceae bacterium]
MLPTLFTDMTSRNANSPCLAPPPLPSFDDKNGPLPKVVGVGFNVLREFWPDLAGKLGLDCGFSQ